MPRNESESEVFCFKNSLFYRSSSGRLYYGSDEKDGCATNEETVLILGEENPLNKGEVRPYTTLLVKVWQPDFFPGRKTFPPNKNEAHAYDRASDNCDCTRKDNCGCI